MVGGQKKGRMGSIVSVCSRWYQVKMGSPVVLFLIYLYFHFSARLGRRIVSGCSRWQYAEMESPGDEDRRRALSYVN